MIAQQTSNILFSRPKTPDLIVIFYDNNLYHVNNSLFTWFLTGVTQPLLTQLTDEGSDDGEAVRKLGFDDSTSDSDGFVLGRKPVRYFLYSSRDFRNMSSSNTSYTSANNSLFYRSKRCLL
jgi:hypothetical protein